jgi:hypothetical protein
MEQQAAAKVSAYQALEVALQCRNARCSSELAEFIEGHGFNLVNQGSSCGEAGPENADRAAGRLDADLSSKR